MLASVFSVAVGASAQEVGRPAARRGGSRRRAVAVQGSAADHPAIGNFLTAVFQGPPPSEFRASLEDPFYRPHDRVLIKQDAQIVAHVQVTRRVMQFGTQRLRVAGLHWLGTLPAYRGQGHARRLLATAERQMASSGALLGLAWTRIPQFFSRAGWVACCRRASCQAGAGDLISGLMTRGLLRRGRKRLNLRPCRRMELGALVRIYNQNLAGTFGPFERTEAYWKWLLQRRGYDQICVALDGPDLLELEENLAPIVGYSVVRGPRIVELLTAPGYPIVAAHLLARACRDAMEHGRHVVEIDARPNGRLDKLFRAAGNVAACARTSTLMVKLLDPWGVLRALAPTMSQRAEAARLPMPVELGLLIDGRKCRLALSDRGAEVVAENLGRSYLRLGSGDLTRLVLGQLDWDRASAEGRIKASTNLAARAGCVCFPRLPLWCPPFDDSPALD